MFFSFANFLGKFKIRMAEIIIFILLWNDKIEQFFCAAKLYL